MKFNYYPYNVETLNLFRKKAKENLTGKFNLKDIGRNIFKVLNESLTSRDIIHLPMLFFENICENGFVGPNVNFLVNYPVNYKEYIDYISSSFWKYYQIAIQANDKYVWIWIIFFGAYTQKYSFPSILDWISTNGNEIADNIIKIICRFPDQWIRELFLKKIIKFLGLKNETDKMKDKKMSVKGPNNFVWFPFKSKNISKHWINPTHEKKFKGYFLSYCLKKISKEKVGIILNKVYKIILAEWKDLYLLYKIKYEKLSNLKNYFKKLAYLLVSINDWNDNRKEYWLWRWKSGSLFSIYDLERICNDIQRVNE